MCAKFNFDIHRFLKKPSFLADTTYEWAVQSICSSSLSSDWTATQEFTTTGGTVTKKVGNTTVFGYLTDAATRRAAKYTMPETGTISSISLYHTAGSGSMILAVYGGTSQPGTLLGKTNTVTVSGSAGWQTVNLQTPINVTAGTTIWLAWVLQYNPGIIAYTSGSAPRADAGLGWYYGMPSSFGSSSLAYYSYSIYANYTTGTGSSMPLAESLEVNAYPVPCSGSLTVSIKEGGNSLVKLVGMNGATVFEKNVSGFEEVIDVSKFATGLYNLIVTSNDKVAIKKIIIEK